MLCEKKIVVFIKFSVRDEVDENEKKEPKKNKTKKQIKIFLSIFLQ